MASEPNTMRPHVDKKEETKGDDTKNSYQLTDRKLETQ